MSAPSRSLAALLFTLVAAGCARDTHQPVNVALRGGVTVLGASVSPVTELSFYPAKEFVTADASAPLAKASTDADGGWSVSQFDAAEVDGGLIATSAGSSELFPTLSGVVDWSKHERVDVTDGALFVVARKTANQVTSLLGRRDLLEEGFVLGLATDGTRPLAGVKVVAGNRLNLPVYYLSPDLKSFEGAETSASGLFVVAPAPALLFLDLQAGKGGHTFDKFTVPLKDGFISVAPLKGTNDVVTPRVDLSGSVISLDGTSTTGATFEAFEPLEIARKDAPKPLDGGVTTVLDGGTFELRGVDVTNVSQGVLGKVSGDGHFPTVSGLTAWKTEADADKVSTANAHIFSMSTQLAQNIANALSVTDLEVTGLVLGVVTDGSTPVAGATVSRPDGKPCVVVYPDADFTHFDGTTTSANGVFILGPGQDLAQVKLSAVKQGWTFATTMLLQPKGVAFFAAIVAEPAHSPITIDVAGLVSTTGAFSVAGASLSVLSPYTHLTTPALTPLATTTVSQTSTFSLPNLAVTNVSSGLLARVEDTAGTIYPTVSGLTAWASEADADKKGTTNAHVFAVPKALAIGLANGLGNPSLLTNGFVMGLVTDGAAGVSGATVALVGGGPLTVLYPDATFTGFGASTSTSGLFIIPSAAGRRQLTLVATKGVVTFGPALALPKAGTCFFSALHP
jgi:hypothetical protein